MAKKQIKSLVLVSFMTSLLVVLSWIPAVPIGIIPVPVVWQNLGIFLIILLLNNKQGTLAIIGLFLVGLAGVPVFSGFKTTINLLLSPTAGYALSWLVAPFLYHLLLKRFKRIKAIWLQAVVLIIVGVCFVDVCGALWLSCYLKINLIKALLCNLIFIPGDLIKVVIAIIVKARLTKLKQLPLAD